MSSALFILAINAGVTLMLAVAFYAMAQHDRSSASARWIGLAYLMGAGYYAAEFTISQWPGSVPLALAGYAAFLLALSSYTVGIARKYGAQPPWRVLLLLVGASLALNLYTQTLPRDLILRNVLWQLPYAALQAVAVVVLLRTPRLGKVDRVLAAVLSLSAVHFLMKPMLAVETGGPGASAASYLDTAYALFSQATGTILAVLVALTTLAAYVVSMMSDANRRSETDTLSGLLNRRGFLLRAEEILASARGPVALVLADIDNFKTVNDTFGHDAGDRVIRAFAEVLAEAAGESHVVGRIGGEEFAVLLSGAELSTARLIAEGARVGIGRVVVPGLPVEGQVSASFGVAQWQDGIGYEELFRQADAALYEAKNAGRDCVRVAPPVLRGDREEPLRRSFRDRI